MKRHSRWFKLKRIVPATILMPPLGLLLMWLSPRSRKFKAVFSIVTFVVFAGAGVVVWKTGYYQRFVEPPVPASGFEVRRSDRGHYIIDRILPLEHEIFSEVVHEMRRFQREQGGTYTELQASEINDPETLAVQLVAERRGMDSAEVSAIFLKVSSKMAKPH